MAQYRPRMVDDEIERKMKVFGAVVIVGPKWCGKTTSARRLSKSALFMQDPDKESLYKETVKEKPSVLLRGNKPRLIDEWQEAPRLWDAVRFAVDQGAGPGAFLLTGSVTPSKDSVMHTGTGRIVKVVMRTMSLFESGDSTGEVSLLDLFNGSSDISGESRLDYASMAEVLVRGGWPASIGKTREGAKDLIKGYCESVLDSEINLPEGRRRDRERMRCILRSLSRHTATGVSNTTVMADINASVNGSTINTVSDYISALKSIYVVEDLNAWNPKLRSKTAIRTSDVRHMSDPAIAAYFLDAGPEDLEADPNTYGLLFESLVIRDLRIYSQKIGGTVHHYRDADGLEADAIVHLDNGRWAAFEVKLGAHAADEAAKSLKKLAGKVDGDITKPAAFLAVITASGYAYTREDGVHVIPLGCLKD